MNRLPVLAVLLAGASFSALASLACSGPTSSHDAGPNGPYGIAGTWGVDGGGGYGVAGTWGGGGSGGVGGPGNPQPVDAGGAPERRRDAGAGGQMGPGPGMGGPGRRRDAAAPADTGASPIPDAGGGASPDAERPSDAGLAECPAGAMRGAPCMMNDFTCMVPAGDGGRASICSCRARGGEGTWRCYVP